MTRFREWLTGRDKREALAWLGLVVVALVVRFYDLGSRPYHHDESQDAYFSFTFSENFGSYEYNPLLHGPVRFYLTALIYKVFGDSDFTARLAPALMGLLAVALPYLLRRQLGRIAAFAAAVILAVGPAFLYFSRFAREDIYLAAVTLAMMVAAFRFLANPRALTLSLFTGLAALAFGIKESGIVMFGFMGLFFVGAIFVQGLLERRRGGSFADGEVAAALLKVRWPAWIYAVATLLVVYGLIYTQFFTNLECVTTASRDHPSRETSCINAVVYGLQYWSDQQHVARGGDSPWLYFSIIFAEEWPALLLGIAGAVYALARPTTLRVFLVLYFAATMGFYMWGSERFAWLVLHPLLPLILLAGLGVQALWDLRRRLAIAVVAIGSVYMVGNSYSANAVLQADPRSWLVSTQSSTQVKDVADQVARLEREAKADGRPLGVTVDSSEGATFPYAWYFRHSQIGYIDMNSEGYVPNTEVLVMTEKAREKLKPSLAAYEGRRFDFRVWWVKDYKKKFSASAWWDWFTKRKAWNPTGGMWEWFYVRRDVGPLPGKGTKTKIPEL